MSLLLLLSRSVLTGGKPPKAVTSPTTPPKGSASSSTPKGAA